MGVKLKQTSISGMRRKLRLKIIQFIKFVAGRFVTGRSFEVFIGFSFYLR